MSKVHPNQVVNTNCLNFLHDDTRGVDVHLIQPDKFTFLKSNLLVSNIVNNHSRQQKMIVLKNQLDTSDAYVNCQIQVKKLEEQNNQKNCKLQRVKNLAKCRSQMIFADFIQKQKNIDDKIQNVHIVKKQMFDKAAQIMVRKEDDSYLGRNMIKPREIILKELKQTKPSQKTQKNETIRLLMKQNAKKCNRKQLNKSLEDSTSTQSNQNGKNQSILNQSVQMSFLDDGNLRVFLKKAHNDQVLRSLLKCKSTENFMQQQRRRAVWNGFSENWKKGGEKHQNAKKQLKKKGTRKQQRPKPVTSDNDVLHYQDNYSRFIALKNYQYAFAETQSLFRLKIENDIG